MIRKRQRQYSPGKRIKRLVLPCFFHSFSTFLGKAGIYLEGFYIKPEYRGKGCGKAVLKKLFAIEVEHSCGRLERSCLDRNKPGIDFYFPLEAEPMPERTTYRIAGTD